MTLVLLWLLLHLKYRSKCGRLGTGIGLCGTVWDGFKVCGDGWGWGQKFVPVQISRWVGCYIWYSEEQSGLVAAPPSPLLAVSNVTAHPSTASVPTSYCSMWH